MRSFSSGPLARIRSSITGDSARYFCRIHSMVVVSCMRQDRRSRIIPQPEIAQLIFSRFLTVRSRTPSGRVTPRPASARRRRGRPADQAAFLLYEEDRPWRVPLGVEPSTENDPETGRCRPPCHRGSTCPTAHRPIRRSPACHPAPQAAGHLATRVELEVEVRAGRQP